MVGPWPAMLHIITRILLLGVLVVATAACSGLRPGQPGAAPGAPAIAEVPPGMMTDSEDP
jgi:hypothetical protein